MITLVIPPRSDHDLEDAELGEQPYQRRWSGSDVVRNSGPGVQGTTGAAESK